MAPSVHIIRKSGMTLCITAGRSATLWPTLLRRLSASVTGGVRGDRDDKKKQRKLFLKDAYSQKSCPTFLHLIDSESINCITKALCPDPQREDSHIVECSAGPGFLTKHLLASHVKHVHVFEHKDNDYVSMLEELAVQHKGRLSLHLSNHHVVDYVRDLRVGFESIVPAISDSLIYKEKWKDDPPIKSFIPLPPFTDRYAVNCIVSDLCRRDGLFAVGRSSLLLLASYFSLSSMMATPMSGSYYGFLSVMAKTMFDIDIRQKILMRSLIPRVRKRRIVVPEGPHMDLNSLFLVSMTPKASLVHDIPIELWTDYRFFVKQAMFRKLGHVIPFFEKYFPNCGIRLIRIGVPLYSRFSELNPSDFVVIFNEFISWPEYSTSTFKMASASFADEDMDEEEEDADRAADGSADVSGGEKLVSDAFA